MERVSRSIYSSDLPRYRDADQAPSPRPSPSAAREPRAAGPRPPAVATALPVATTAAAPAAPAATTTTAAAAALAVATRGTVLLRTRRSVLGALDQLLGLDEVAVLVLGDQLEADPAALLVHLLDDDVEHVSAPDHVLDVA